MKRIINILLVVLLAVSFTACTPQQDERGTDIVIDESLLLEGNILSRNIVCSLNNKSTPEQPEFNFLQFAVFCGAVCNQPDCPYYNLFPADDDTGDAMINIHRCSRMIERVFGEKWNIAENIPGGFAVKVVDDIVQFPTAIGWGLLSYSAGDYIYSDFSDDNTQVVSHFELFAPDSSSGDPGKKSIGDYKIIYDIISQDDEIFLRFNRFEKS